MATKIGEGAYFHSAVFKVLAVQLFIKKAAFERLPSYTSAQWLASLNRVLTNDYHNA